MPGKRYTAQQIVAKLREAEKLQGNGLNRPGMSRDSEPWKGWSHVREYVEEVPDRAA